VTSSLAAIGWPVIDRFRFGEVAISPHGIGIAIGFLIGAWLLGRLGPKRGVSPDDISSMVLWALVGTIVGARFFYVIAHLEDYEGNVLEMLSIWKGGISLLGGIAGAILVNVPIMRRRGYRFFQVMDAAVIALALGIAIGRVGDLVIGDHLGKPTDFPLAFSYLGGQLAPPFHCEDDKVCRAVLEDGSALTITEREVVQTSAEGDTIARGEGVHQTALYDILGAWPLFFLLRGMNRRPRREGVLTLTFGLWYGPMRVITDFLRVDKRFLGLTGSQWTAATVAIICAVMLIAWAARAKAVPVPAIAPEDDAAD